MKSFRILGAIVAGLVAVESVSFGDGAASPAKPAESSTTYPLQLALVPAVEFVNEDYSVAGVRLNIYGSNRNMKGVDIGLLHETKGEFAGVAFGLVSWVRGDGRGLQFDGLYSGTDGTMAGLQVGIVNHSANIHGIQIGLANFADDMTGIQIGLWNEIKSKDQWKVIPIINAAF